MPTSKASSSVTSIVVSVVVESSCPLGSALTEEIWLPWRPVGVPPVDAPWIRCQIAASEPWLTRSSAVTNSRRRDVETLDLLVLQHGLGGRLERVRPDDVAREQPLRLREELLARDARVGLVHGRLERVLEPAQPVGPVAERLDRARVRADHRARRVQILRPLHLGVGGLDVAAEPRVEILLVQTRRREQRAQLLAESRRRVPDRADVGEVRAVAIALRVGRAALDPDDEQDDDEDRERDEPDQAQERREVARRSEPRASAAPATVAPAEAARRLRAPPTPERPPRRRSRNPGCLRRANSCAASPL